MKILHVSGAMSWGGNEQQLVDLIFGLKKLEVNNLLFCFKGSELEKYCQLNNINFFSVDKAKGHSLKLAKSFKEYSKSINPDVIHLHTSNSVTFFMISDIIYNLKTPAVFSKKGISGSVSFLSKLKYNYKNINKIICVSNAVSEAFKLVLKSKNHDKLCVVYDGIKIERAKHKSTLELRNKFNISNDKILIGNIANHTRAKDLVTLVETINILVNQKGIKNIHLVQIGKKGKYSDEFIPLIKKYGLQDYITITGFLENAMDLLNQLDIYLMTSEREGLPITIYESFFKRIPVISTMAGGIPEAIEHNFNGLLSEIKKPNELANNLEKLIFDKELRNLFSERSYEILLEKFTSKQLAKNTLQVYNSVI